MKTGISIVLLAYREEENLKVLLPEIRNSVLKTGEDFEFLVVDTALPLDQTEEVCKEFGARYVRQESPGFGGAFRTGVKYAEMDKIMFIDSDGSHDPKHIPGICEKFKSQKFDVVIGSRYCPGGVTHDSQSSILMSRVLNTVFRICLGIYAKDISSNFRMYDAAQLKAVSLRTVNYDVLQEVLLMMKKKNPALKIGESPIRFEKRMFGESKRRLIPFIIDYMKSVIRLTGIRFFS